MEAIEAITIGELLGLTAEQVSGIGFYDIGHEPVSSPQRRPQGRARRLRLKQLDRYIDDARAGVTDAAIARNAGCTTAQIRRWRISRGIRRMHGRPTTHARATAAATVFFGREFVSVLSRVDTSAVGGLFSPPEYVLREPLRYDVLVRCITTLRDAGFSQHYIATGLGLREPDVEQAEKIGRQ